MVVRKQLDRYHKIGKPRDIHNVKGTRKKPSPRKPPKSNMDQECDSTQMQHEPKSITEPPMDVS